MKRYLVILAILLSAVAAHAQVTQTLVVDKRQVSPGDYRVQLNFKNAGGQVLHNGEYPFDNNLPTVVRDQIALLVGGRQAAFDALVPGTSTITPAAPAVAPPASTAGSYRAATVLITGAVTIQNLASIENPASALLPLTVTDISIDGTVVAIATTQFNYRVGRTTALPTGGTVITAQKTDSGLPAATAIVRQAPTATAAAGDVWTGQANPLITAAGQAVSTQKQMEDRITLLPGEALVVRAEANTAGWRHSVTFKWDNQ